MGCVNQRLLRVADDVGAARKLRLVAADDRGSVLGVRINPPELYPGWTKLPLQAQHFGLVAIGDRAIGGSKEKHDRRRSRLLRASRHDRQDQSRKERLLRIRCNAIRARLQSSA